MINVRKNVFETNSSSTHSICISKDTVKNMPKEVKFQAGEYGWEEDTVYATASYLWTAILDGPQELVEERTQKLKDALDRLGVKGIFEYPPKDEYGFYTDCYIDHSCECADLIDALLSNDDLLARYLFGDSCIYTGNDNDSYDDENYPNKYLAFPNHPCHEESLYDYFFKGN